MKARKFTIRTGVGISNSENRLPSFDKALLDAGVGNYNLVRLSSILPAHCEECYEIDLEEGSLLPTAYATITSNESNTSIVSCIGIGLPKDSSKVGVIMEYSDKNISSDEAETVVNSMIQEAFKARNWDLDRTIIGSAYAKVDNGETVSTFACVAEWE